MVEAPRVFISYSHDSSAHKQWVAQFAGDLVRHGVDAILDQWDVGPGDDLARFMETGVTRSDRVLVICTDEYIRKADAGEGGVGYEKMIVTAELVQDLGTDRFIPVIRNVSGVTNAPKFLGVRMYVDLSDEASRDEEFEKLLRELHHAPAAVKPPLGHNPFISPHPVTEESAPAGQPQAPVEGSDRFDSPAAVYSTALRLVRENDLLGWRQFVKRIRLPTYRLLAEWRHAYEDSPPVDPPSLAAATDDAVRRAAQLMVLSLAGVESGSDRFSDQRALLDDLLTISGWSESGHKRIVSLPLTLAYVYQALHGAMATRTDRPDIALRLANMDVFSERMGRAQPLWERHEVIGWPETLGGSCSDAWEYLYGAPERWKWLPHVFESADDYRVALVAYYMVLSLNELSVYVRSGSPLDAGRGPLSAPHIPLCFLMAEAGINQRAAAQVRRHIPLLLSELSVTGDAMQRYWGPWIRLCGEWLVSAYRSPFILRTRGSSYAGLFQQATD